MRGGFFMGVRGARKTGAVLPRSGMLRPTAILSGQTFSGVIPMPDIVLHHVSISCTDLAVSVDFYTRLLGLSVLKRPPFRSRGARLG